MLEILKDVIKEYIKKQEVKQKKLLENQLLIDSDF
jgi:hypothetical protein